MTPGLYQLRAMRATAHSDLLDKEERVKQALAAVRSAVRATRQARKMRDDVRTRLTSIELDIEALEGFHRTVNELKERDGA